MANFFRNKVITGVGMTPVTAVETLVNSSATVIGLSLANITDNLVTANVYIRDADSVVGHYIKEVMVPPNTSLRVINGGEKLIMANLNGLLVSCNVDSGIDAIISYVEII